MTRVKITNLSPEATEDSGSKSYGLDRFNVIFFKVSDYFSFCGDIKSITVTSSKDESSKEAVIDFENEAAASTAVLLNNALVEGRNIVVEIFNKLEDGASTAAAPITGTASEIGDGKPATPKSVISDIVSEAKSVAGQVSSASKDFNTKYDLTGKIKNAYGTASAATVNTAHKIDENLHISEGASKAYETTKKSFNSLCNSVTSFFSQKSESEEKPATTE